VSERGSEDLVGRVVLDEHAGLLVFMRFRQRIYVLLPAPSWPPGLETPEHLDAVLFQLGADERSELGVDRWQHCGELLDDSYRKPARSQGFGHLEPDVTGADDNGGLRHSSERGVEEEAIADGVQLVDAWAVDAGHGRSHRSGTRRDYQLVVAKSLLASLGSLQRDCPRPRFDPGCRVLEQQLDAGALELFSGPMGEAPPVRDVSREEIGQATDREVRITVGQKHRHLDIRIELARATPR
jgi:hypothetical protein